MRLLYRQEQLTRELELEQRRYGRNYWEAECGGPELAKLQQVKDAILKQLSAEANQVLRDLFPDDASEPITLVAIFDVAHAGPNLNFLSPASRERFESELLANDDARGVERERLLEIAAGVLPSSELESYRQWNAASAAALRAQLVGFNPNESEFVAILHETSLTAEDGEARATDSALEALLGVARYGDFLKVKDPAVQTAVHDLQRAGLPLGEAEWLAATRARAVAEIGDTWQSAVLTDAMKRERIAQIERAYGEAIAAKLAVSAAALDGLGVGS